MSGMLNEVLTLVSQLDRDLEPWVCDIICDNLQQQLAAETQLDVETLEVNTALGEILQIISKGTEYNAKLRLRIVKLSFGAGIVRRNILPRLMSDLKDHPAEVFDIFTTYIQPKTFDEAQNGNSNDYWDPDINGMGELQPALIAASRSPNRSTRQAAVRLAAAIICSSRLTPGGGSFPHEALFQDLTFLIDVVAWIFKSGQEHTAAAIAQELLSKQLESDTLPALCPVRVHLVVLKLQETSPLLPTSLNYTSGTSYWKTFYKLFFDKLPNYYNQPEIHIEEILKNLCSNLNVDILACISRSAVLRQISTTSTWVSKLLPQQFKSFPLLPKVLDTVYDECVDLQSQRAALAFLDDLMELKLLEDVIKVSHVCRHQRKCSGTASRSNHPVADSNHSSSVNNGTPNLSNGAAAVHQNHSSSTTPPPLLCFISTLLTFLSECTPDTLSVCADTLYKIFTLPFFRLKCTDTDMLTNLNSLLARKLRQVDSRVRDLALELFRKVDPSVLESDNILLVVEMACSDGDYYVKSSCFKVLGVGSVRRVLQAGQQGTSQTSAAAAPYAAGHFSSTTPPILTAPLSVTGAPMSVVGMLGRMVDSVEHDDSMVAIAFFNFLQENYEVVLSKLLSTNMVCLRQMHSDNLQKPGTLQNSDNPQVPLLVNETRLDDVIHSVCDTPDCSDVDIIRGYDDRMTPSNNLVTSPDHVITGLFRLLTTDRCDIERMKASLELVTEMLERLGDNSCMMQTHVITTHLVEYLTQSKYFDMVESFNGPYLRESVRKFNVALAGVRVFEEKIASGRTDLETVLALLQATPDPNIVCDCY